MALLELFKGGHILVRMDEILNNIFMQNIIIFSYSITFTFPIVSRIRLYGSLPRSEPSPEKHKSHT